MKKNIKGLLTLGIVVGMFIGGVDVVDSKDREVENINVYTESKREPSQDSKNVQDNIEKAKADMSVESRAKREVKALIEEKTGVEPRIDIIMTDKLGIKDGYDIFENYIFQIEHCSNEIYTLKQELINILGKYKGECKHIKLQLGYEMLIIS